MSEYSQPLVKELLTWARRATEYAERNKYKIAAEHIDEFQKWRKAMSSLIGELEGHEKGFRTSQEQELRRKSEKLYQQLIDLFKHKVVKAKVVSTLKSNWHQPHSNQSQPDPAHTHQSQAKSIQSNESHSNAVPQRTVPIGEHTLPPLPYDYNALEPYISAEIMRLHHQKHHQSYVDGLNKAEKKLQEARRKGDFDLIKHWERELAFHGSGHYLHTIFWNIMSPEGGGRPTGQLLQEIKKAFGSYDQFKKQFTEAADKAEGVGWAILVWSPRSQRLEILQSEKHQFFAQWDVIPILVLDVWEHAYYLQYKADRKKYIDQWWNTVNWDHVQYRLDEAKKVRWHPY